jgi:hypothetical protein
VAICVIPACPDLEPGLAPLQVGVGVRRGAQCLGNAVSAGAVANPEDVTPQTGNVLSTRYVAYGCYEYLQNVGTSVTAFRTVDVRISVVDKDAGAQ